jgi:hypothetical protein
MIAPYTVLDVRSGTAFEPYTFDSLTEARKSFDQMAINTIEKKQTRSLHLYEEGDLLVTFNHIIIGD